MTNDTIPTSPEVAEAIEDLKIKSEISDNDQITTPLPNLQQLLKSSNANENSTPSKNLSPSRGLKSENDVDPKIESASQEETMGGDIMIKSDPGKPVKLSRSASHKIPKRNLPLFTDLPDKTVEATSIFSVIDDCTYQNKNIGLTDDDSFECECSPEWGKS